jgi:hypothetical protein
MQHDWHVWTWIAWVAEQKYDFWRRVLASQQ